MKIVVLNLTENQAEEGDTSRKVRIKLGRKVIEGEIIQVTESGDLLVRTRDGNVVKVPSKKLKPIHA